MINLEALLDQAITSIGYEMVDLEVLNRGRLLRVFVDKPAGVTIDDCALISEHISHFLAVEHDFDYDRLEVSSPGLDRVIKKPADFERFAGNKVQVKLRVPVEGRKKLVGVLQGLRDEQILVVADGAEFLIALGNVDKARLSPEF